MHCLVSVFFLASFLHAMPTFVLRTQLVMLRMYTSLSQYFFYKTQVWHELNAPSYHQPSSFLAPVPTLVNTNVSKLAYSSEFWSGIVTCYDISCWLCILTCLLQCIRNSIRRMVRDSTNAKMLSLAMKMFLKFLYSAVLQLNPNKLT